MPSVPIKKKHLTFFLKLLVSMAIGVWALSSVNYKLVQAHLSGASLGLLVFAGLVLLAASFPHMARWHRILQVIGHPVRFSALFRPVMASYFFMQVLPTFVGGDATRMWWARRYGIGLRGAINSVILDRVAALCAMVLLIAVTFNYLVRYVPNQAALSGVAMLLVLVFFGLLFLWVLPVFAVRLKSWRILAPFLALGEDLRKMAGQPQSAAIIVGLSLLVHLAVVGIMFILLFALGLHIGFLDCLLLIPPVMLISSIPITVAGWGVREGAMIFALQFAGISSEGALAASLLFGVLSLGVGLIGGAVWTVSLSIDYRRGVNGYRRNKVASYE